MTRVRRISERTRALVSARQDGRCNDCGMDSDEVKRRAEQEGASYKALMEFDHITPRALDGSDDETNVQMLCHFCHREKTTQRDVPMIAGAKRLAEKAAGGRKSRSPVKWWKRDAPEPDKLSRLAAQRVIK